MLAIYVATTIVGGALVLLSAFGGAHDSDHDFDMDADADIDLDVDVDVDADVDADLEVDHDVGTSLVHGKDLDLAESMWLPFLSMRFWTYTATFFGTTGLLLSWIVPGLGAGLTALVAAGTGSTTGLGMAYTTRYFKKQMIHSGIGEGDLVGNLAKVLLTVRKGDFGKVRCEARGQNVDLIATTDDDEPLTPGSGALIIGFDGPTARVVRSSYPQGEPD